MTATEPIPPEILHRLDAAVFGAMGRQKFRGEIWESSAGVPMGRGYSNDGKPFDIETACYLKPVLRAIRNPDIPVVGVLAAVQMLKTFGCIEEPAAYFVEHDPGDTTIYIGGDDSARDQARSRIIPRLRAIPGVAAQLAAAEASNRFDISTQEFYLPGMVLRIWGLNENTTQRITLRRVLISDAFLSKKTGMINQAISRTTQHRHDRKIIIESQGGEEGDDMDVFWHSTGMGMLHVVCPDCGSGLPYEFHHERLDDFIAKPPLAIPSLDRAAWVAHHTPLLLKERHAGFKRGDDDLIRRADGTYNEAEIFKQTYYECPHCGSHWTDTPMIRKKLDDSSYYVPSNPNAMPGYVGFSWPAWAGQRLPWGGEEVMLGYLRAKQQHEKFGDVEMLKQWYQKRAARPWAPKLTAVTAPVITGSYNVKGKIPNELCRVMFVDCQQDPALTAATGKSTMGHYWYVARAIDADGNLFQLARGYAMSEAEWRKVQERLEIINENVGIDGGNWRSDVIDLAARHITEYVIRDNRRRVNREKHAWLCYKVLVGMDGGPWKWPDGRYRAVAPNHPEFRNVTIKEKQLAVQVPVHGWSNLLVKDQLAALMAGGEGRVKFLSLARKELDEPARIVEQGNLSYENQMSAEYRTFKKNGRPIWERARPDNHYWDCECGCLVLFGLGGYLGIAAPEGDQ